MRSHPLAASLHRAVARVALAGAVLIAATVLESAAVAQRERAWAARASAAARAATARRTEQVRAAYLPRYERLKRRGLLGPAPRLELAEALRRSARELRLRDVTFQLQPPVFSGAVASSRMTVRAGVAHEGELVRLLDRLGAYAPAVLWPTQCNLERAAEATAGPARDADNLVAECELEWLTVGPAP